jgi:hypothetical protein
VRVWPAASEPGRRLLKTNPDCSQARPLLLQADHGRLYSVIAQSQLAPAGLELARLASSLIYKGYVIDVGERAYSLDCEDFAFRRQDYPGGRRLAERLL